MYWQKVTACNKETCVGATAHGHKAENDQKLTRMCVCILETLNYVYFICSEKLNVKNKHEEECLTNCSARQKMCG